METSRIPDDVDVDLRLRRAREEVDLRFLADLPPDRVVSLVVHPALDDASIGFVTHLAPGLRRLYLANTGLHDDSLASVAELASLSFLQTWGNCFTDEGVQVLARLNRLEELCLEEETLSVRAFDVAAALPRLARLGLHDVPISEAELAGLRAALPHVKVG